MLYQLSYVGSNNKSCIERYGITSREDAAVRSLAFNESAADCRALQVDVLVRVRG